MAIESTATTATKPNGATPPAAAGADPNAIVLDDDDNGTTLQDDGDDTHGDEGGEPSPYAKELEGVTDGDRNGATDEDVAWARRNRWVPKAEWRGDPLDWVDAKSYAGRARGVNEVLAKHNRDLQAKFDKLTQEVEELRSQGQTSRLSEVEANLAAARVRAKHAREESDFDAYEVAQRDITALETQQREIKARSAPRKPSLTTDDTEAAQTWERDNGVWYEKDPQKTRIFNAVAMEVRQTQREIVGNTRAFLRECDRICQRDYPEMFGASMTHSRTNGTTNTARPSRPSARAKGWDELPQEAKDVADRMIRRNPKLTRKDYAEEYWKENA